MTDTAQILRLAHDHLATAVAEMVDMLERGEDTTAVAAAGKEAIKFSGAALNKIKHVKLG